MFLISRPASACKYATRTHTRPFRSQVRGQNSKGLILLAFQPRLINSIMINYPLKWIPGCLFRYCGTNTQVLFVLCQRRVNSTRDCSLKIDQALWNSIKLNSVSLFTCWAVCIVLECAGVQSFFPQSSCVLILLSNVGPALSWKANAGCCYFPFSEHCNKTLPTGAGSMCVWVCCEETCKQHLHGSRLVG